MNWDYLLDPPAPEPGDYLDEDTEEHANYTASNEYVFCSCCKTSPIDSPSENHSLSSKSEDINF